MAAILNCETDTSPEVYETLATVVNSADSIQNYDVINIIGKGSFSHVKKACKKNSDHCVAIKMIPFFSEDYSTCFKKSCIQGIRMIKKLNHPNIVRYISTFLNGTDLCVVMEWAKEDFSQYIQQFKNTKSLVEEKTIWFHFSQLCSAVKYLHSVNIVHRDIKPANVLLSKNNVVKLADFDFAIDFCVEEASVLPKAGTLHYMAPECIKEKHDVKADIWSLGCILYELAVLESPFFVVSHGADFMEAFENLDYSPIPFEGYSCHLRHTVFQCLQPDPMKRVDSQTLCSFAEKMEKTFNESN